MDSMAKIKAMLQSRWHRELPLRELMYRNFASLTQVGMTKAITLKDVTNILLLALTTLFSTPLAFHNAKMWFL